MRVLAVTFGLMFSASAAFAGDPVGRYTVSGNNPGNGSSYSGTATVEKTGDAFRVTWDVGGTKYTGTALGNEKFFAVTYRSGNQTGLAMYGDKGENWEGVWTYAGGRQIGLERWTRR